MNVQLDWRFADENGEWETIAAVRSHPKKVPWWALSTVLAALVVATGRGEVFLDVPSVNPAAVALAQSYGLKPVFETARMYTGPIRKVNLDRLFGVMTFELG